MLSFGLFERHWWKNLGKRKLFSYGKNPGRNGIESWRKIPPLPRKMDRMASAKLGYKRRIVSDPSGMRGVDILSCPYHELAKELGAEKAVRCICHMDNKYMQGYRHIRYERSMAVSEGDACCDYRLQYDKSKS